MLLNSEGGVPARYKTSKSKFSSRAVIQQFLEAEMAKAVGAEKGERVEGRLDYRSGYYTRRLVTRVGKLELESPGSQ